jgi:hypothetical protein
MTAPINDGGPAFPIHGSMGEVVQQGMLLRDYFAAKAMQGLLAGNFMDLGRAADKTNQKLDEMVAETALRVADAMLKVRAS